MDRSKCASQTDLKKALSSPALLASNNDLGQMLSEVDTISETLRSGLPGEQSLRVAVHPAVWSAVRQALPDRELRYLALTDDLTCLYNRRGFFAAAMHQLKIAQRNAQVFLFFYCDVDGLKKINDSYGHREGDMALARIADALVKTFRDSDVLARIGGDEFVVLAPEAVTQEVILRRLEKNLKRVGAGETRYQLSLSVGVSRFDPQNAVTLGKLMANADEAMYVQKKNRTAGA